MSGLYKGFIATKGKQPIEKYKDKDRETPFRNYAQIKKLPDFAGVLRDDCILIDIDDAEQAEKLMTIIEDYQIRCRVTCTSRGKHFTFRNSGVRRCGTHLKLACGLIADIKTGGNPEVLKTDGVERFCEWGEEDPEKGVYDELPTWLHPVNTKMDFLTTKARNSDFYGYILVLQTQLGMPNDECKQTIQIINDYILQEPLERSELDVILRDEAFEKPTFFDGKRFLHDSFANWMINQHHVKCINGQLHVYKDGIYRSGYRNIEYLMIKANSQIRDTQRKEVLKYLEVVIPDNTRVTNATYMAFANGVYNISDDTMAEFSPDMIITSQIPWNYNPNAYSELADHVLNRLACNDAEVRLMLEECVGYCFFRRNELSKAIFLTGQGANGKSTYLDMLRNVLGQHNISALDIDEIDERFSVATMFGKLANIGDDITDEYLYGRCVAHFKKLVSGNMVKAENKGQDAFFYSPTVKLLFSANTVPRMKDRTGAALRRMVIIPFNARFTKKDPDFDPYIQTKLEQQEVMEYLCRIGVEGLKRILKNRDFSTSKQAVAAVNEYKEYNNPILLFLKEVEEDEIMNQDTKLIHSKYERFCSENGFQSMGTINFSREICRQLECQTKQIRDTNNQRVRVFTR